MNSPSVPEYLLPEIKIDAATCNVKMLAEKYGFTYNAMYNYVTRHKIQTATVKQPRQNFAGRDRKAVEHIKEGCFNVNEYINWLIGGTQIKDFRSR